jgi:hypothetical protein
MSDVKYPLYRFDVQQNTPAWEACRLGRVTASAAAPLLVDGKGRHGFGAGALTYAKKKAMQILTGEFGNSFSNKSTDLGHENEPIAAAIYEATNFVRTKECGFVFKNDRVGCSPDRLVGDDGGLEIKSPSTRGPFWDFVMSGKFNKEYLVQCQFSLWVTGREWWDLAMYNASFPKGQQFWSIRLEPDLEMHGKFDERIPVFLKYIDELVDEFQNKFKTKK